MNTPFSPSSARWYLAAYSLFVGSLVLISLTYDAYPAHLHGWSQLLALIPFASLAAMTYVAHELADQASGPLDDRPFLIVWGLTGLWLFLGLGIPSALARIRG